jgi:Ni2+-binding GTPase involved in maturation of urease and hydrogenase
MSRTFTKEEIQEEIQRCKKNGGPILAEWEAEMILTAKYDLIDSVDAEIFEMMHSQSNAKTPDDSSER